MIYRTGVKGEHQGLQSVAVHFTVSSLPVVLRSGLCLQPAQVIGEKPAFHSRQKKAVGYLRPGKDKHGLKTVVNQSLAFARWEQGSRRHDVFIFIPTNPVPFVEVAGMIPLPPFEDVFSI